MQVNTIGKVLAEHLSEHVIQKVLKEEKLMELNSLIRVLSRFQAVVFDPGTTDGILGSTSRSGHLSKEAKG